MTGSLQFSVTRLNMNTYKVIVQDERIIIRSSEVLADRIMDKLRYEIEQLKSMEKDHD